MRKFIVTASIAAILPTLSACSFLPQGMGFGHQNNYETPQAPHHQAGQYHHQSAYNYSNTAQAPAVRSQGDLWCSDVGCSPKNTYSVSPQPTASYGVQPSPHAYGTHAAPYAAAPKLRGAHKSGNQPYYYGNLGVVSYDTDSDLLGLQSRVGYQSNNIWGAEVEGSIGLDDDTVNDLVNLETSTVDVDYSVGAFALARLPLGERFSVHARGGYHATKISTDVDDGTIITEFSNEFDGFAYGAGAEFNVTPKDALRLDYTRYEGEGSDLDSISLGYARKF